MRRATASARARKYGAFTSATTGRRGWACCSWIPKRPRACSRSRVIEVRLTQKSAAPRVLHGLERALRHHLQHVVAAVAAPHRQRLVVDPADAVPDGDRAQAL